MSTLYHAWYTTKGAELFGSVIYLRPDGTEVEVTCVANSPDYYLKMGWDDLTYLGVVTRYVGTGEFSFFLK